MITGAWYYGSLKILVPFVPVCINFFEIFNDRMQFNYDRSWLSAAVGLAYASVWILVRLVLELAGIEDLATIVSDRSLGAFIYYMKPEYGRDLLAYIGSTLLIFVGQQYAV